MWAYNVDWKDWVCMYEWGLSTIGFQAGQFQGEILILVILVSPQKWSEHSEKPYPVSCLIDKDLLPVFWQPTFRKRTGSSQHPVCTPSLKSSCFQYEPLIFTSVQSIYTGTLLFCPGNKPLIFWGGRRGPVAKWFYWEQPWGIELLL